MTERPRPRLSLSLNGLPARQLAARTWERMEGHEPGVGIFRTRTASCGPPVMSRYCSAANGSAGGGARSAQTVIFVVTSGP